MLRKKKTNIQCNFQILPSHERGTFLVRRGSDLSSNEAGSTQPLTGESPLLSYKITHVCTLLLWSTEVTCWPFVSHQIFAVVTLLSVCICCAPPMHKGSSPFTPVFSFLTETRGLYLACLESPACCWCAVPTVTVKKARSQSEFWLPLLFNLHFSSLLHITASSPEFGLSLVHLLSSGCSYSCKWCS